MSYDIRKLYEKPRPMDQSIKLLPTKVENKLLKRESFQMQIPRA